MNLFPVFSITEHLINKYSIVFALIVMFQGVFGGMTIKHKPKVIDRISDTLVFKYITLTAIAYTATRDIETAVTAVAAFVVLMYILKSPEEREKHGFFNL